MSNLKDWKTTVIGIVTLLLGALSFFGIIDPSQQSTIFEWVQQIVAIIAGIILMFFSKDGFKSE